MRTETSEKKERRRIAVPVLFLLSLFLVLTFRVVIASGRSMLPTISPGQRVVCFSIFPFADPHVGDAVLIERNGRQYIKRIYAAPGDSVTLDGQTFDYWNTSPSTSDSRVPTNCYFVLGDNRDLSLDSRDEDFGLIKREEIQAFVLFAF